MSKFSKIFFIVCLLFITIDCADNESTKSENHIDDPQWLSASGNMIVDEDGNQVVLHGVNRSGLEYDMGGNGINQAEIDYICNEWKANIIRIPFNQEWATVYEPYVKTLDNVIEWISANNAYTLLDLQWQNKTVKIPAIPDTNAITMWEKLAERYKDNSAVLYDIHNEAHNTTWPAWRERASQIIEAIQAVHPRALIFVSGLDWAYDLRGWENQPLTYDNIVYSTHPYPFKGEPWAWDEYFGNFSKTHPVFAGEFGGGADDIDWGNQLISYFGRKKIGWTAWSWVDQPHLTDQSDRRTPTVFGELVKSAMVRYSMADSISNVITELQINNVTSSSAIISWRTEIESDSKVLYGKLTENSDSLSASAFLKYHSMTLTGLSGETDYYFKVKSTDDLGILTVESQDSSFTTK